MTTDTEVRPRPGEVVIRKGQPVTFCDPCNGTGDPTSPDDKFCMNCFGAGIAPVLDTARFRFNQVTTPAQHVHEHLSANGSGKTSGARPVKMASEKQVRFIKDLALQTGITHTEGGKVIADLTEITPGFTGHRAGEVIDFLKAKPKVRKSARRNRLEQDCHECGNPVPATEGLLTNEGGRWIVRHDGECPKVLTAEEREIALITERFSIVDPPIDLTDLPSGRYADPTDEDSSLKILISRNEEETIISVHDAAVYGEHGQYGAQLQGETYRGKVADRIHAILSDPRGAVARYGQLTSSCGMCGRHLEDGEHRGTDGLTSLERGIGPWCAKKHGWI